MRQLNGVYTQAFNRRHGRVGHLFQGCYKSILVDRMEPNLSEKISADEIPRRERLAHRPDLEELFSGQEGKEQRSKATYQAHVEWGYPLKDIGEILGVHYAAVSCLVRREEAEMWRCKT